MSTNEEISRVLIPIKEIWSQSVPDWFNNNFLSLYENVTSHNNNLNFHLVKSGFKHENKDLAFLLLRKNPLRFGDPAYNDILFYHLNIGYRFGSNNGPIIIDLMIQFESALTSLLGYDYRRRDLSKTNIYESYQKYDIIVIHDPTK